MTQTSSKPDTARDGEVKPFPARAEAEAKGPAPDAAPAQVQGKVAAGDEDAKKGGGRKRVVLGALVLAAVLFGGWKGYDYWTVGRFMVSTDDAYLKADSTAIAPKVQGYVSTIAVHENQKVKAGDVLLRLDDGDYVNALKMAESKVSTQKVTIRRIEAQTEAAKASVEQAQASRQAADATLVNAQRHFDRVQSLMKSSVAAQAQLDDAKTALDQAKAQLAGAKAAVAAANANVAVLTAQAAEAQSGLQSLTLAVDQAQRNLGRTVLRAPVDGTVANISARVGDLVSPGQKIAAVVPTGALYIRANYKETQLDGIAPGETAQLTIDALPGRVFTAKVASVSPATGSEFSLLPPQNATGNFTKVVQRVPVRLSLPEELLKSGRLQAGLSVVVDIDRRTNPAN